MDQKWQPIETAPRDGRWVLGGNTQGLQFTMAFRPLLGETPMRYDWIIAQFASGGACTNVCFNPVTHWMPLPEPPNA